jgi:paraquat-inducible protein A
MMRAVYYPIALILAILVVSASLDASRLTRIASSHQNLEGSTELAWKSLLETLSLSLYSGASETNTKTAALFREAAQRQALAASSALAFLTVATIFLLAQAWRERRDPRTSDLGMTADLLGVGVICLGVGLLAPVLSLRAYTDLPVLGEVVLKYEAKSVITTIGSLARANNYFVALLVAAFSVVTPIVKIVVAIAVVQRRWPRWHSRGLEFIKAIGKWSMADVFVVAVLVAYFAASSDAFSDARIGLGLYFFAAYCLLSQYATHALMRTFEDEPALR